MFIQPRVHYTCLTDNDARGLPIHGAEEMYGYTPTRTVSIESMLDRRTRSRNSDKRGLMLTDPVDKNHWQQVLQRFRIANSISCNDSSLVECPRCRRSEIPTRDALFKDGENPGQVLP